MKASDIKDLIKECIMEEKNESLEEMKVIQDRMAKKLEILKQMIREDGYNVN